MNGDEIEAWQTSISLANLVAIPTVFMSVALFVWPAQVAWVLAPAWERRQGCGRFFLCVGLDSA